MGRYSSTKVYDGYSTVFRQWKASGTHCRFLHGYDVYFKIWFEGDLDEKNWVFDFGRAKRSSVTIDGMSPKVWLDYLLDHTVIAAEDDPALKTLKRLDDDGVIQLRVVPAVGAEKFAEYLYDRLNDWVVKDSDSRVYISKIEFFEHPKNSAIYTP